jgi:hypothetical protein
MLLKIVVGTIIGISSAIMGVFVIAFALISYVFDTLFKKGESDL